MLFKDLHCVILPRAQYILHSDLKSQSVRHQQLGGRALASSRLLHCFYDFHNVEIHILFPAQTKAGFEYIANGIPVQVRTNAQLT